MATRRKIPPSRYAVWLLVSQVNDFWIGWMLMLLAGSLGGHWGYWHAWWISFTGVSVISGALYCATRFLEYIGEQLSE